MMKMYLRLCRNQEYVALKVSVADVGKESQELKVLRTLAGLNSRGIGSRHVMRLLDHFQIQGPNGKHECLVLELLGPSITDVVETRFNDERLPGSLARASVQQAFLGLAYLHKHNIIHGGMTTLTLYKRHVLMHRRSAHSQLDFRHSFPTHSHRSGIPSKATKT